MSITFTTTVQRQVFCSLFRWACDHFRWTRKKKWCSRQFAFIIAFGKMKMLYCVHCRWCWAAFFRLFMWFRSRIPGQRKNDIVQQLGFNERYAWFYVHVPHTDSIAPLQTRTMLGVWRFFFCSFSMLFMVTQRIEKVQIFCWPRLLLVFFLYAIDT